MTKTFFSPSGVLSGTWSIFLLGHMIFAPDYVFSYSSGFIILFLILTFACGEIFSFLLSYAGKARPHGPGLKQGSPARHEPELKNTILIMGITSICGAFLYFQIFQSYFGSFANLISAGWSIRDEIGSGAIPIPLYIRIMTLIAYSTISLSFIYWICFDFKPFLLLPFATVIIFGATQAARAGTFMVLIWVFVAGYWRDRLNGLQHIGLRLLRRVLIFIFVVLAIFILGLMYREQKFDFEFFNTHLWETSKVYAFGSVSAFAEFWNSYSIYNPITGGAYSFSSLFELLGLKTYPFGVYGEYLDVSRTANVYTNVFTLFRSLIEDFSLLGAFGFMFCLGLMSARVYKKAIRGDLSAVSLITILYTLLIYSTIAPLTQHNSLLLSFVLPPVMIKMMGLRMVGKPYARESICRV